MNNKLMRMRKVAVVLTFESLSGICLERLRRSTKYLSIIDVPVEIRNANLLNTSQKLLPLEPTRSVLRRVFILPIIYLDELLNI